MYIPSSISISIIKYVEKEKEILGRKADSDLLMTHNGLMIAHYCRTLTSANGRLFGRRPPAASGCLEVPRPPNDFPLRRVLIGRPNWTLQWPQHMQRPQFNEMVSELLASGPIITSLPTLTIRLVTTVLTGGPLPLAVLYLRSSGKLYCGA